MSDFFFARQNDDGTFGEPIKAEVVDLDFTTQGVGDPTPIPSFTEDMEMSFELDYKQTKNLAWVLILNLKRCKKHLISKNIRGYNNGTIQLNDRS